MYLSKIELDIGHPSVRQALHDANDMHRNLMSGFPMRDDDDTPRANMHVLYRVIEKRNQIYILVSSDYKPDPKALSACGFKTDDSMVRDISALRDIFTAGMVLQFELFASPCQKTGGGKRVFLKTPDERADWLQRKGVQSGFEVLTCSEIGGRRDIFARKGSKSIKNAAVLFAGLLRIVDPDAFWDSYVHGIGPGKAYGLGMLNVAKA